MVSDRAFTFHMCIPCGQTFSLVPRSRSCMNVKVKYQPPFFKKNGCYRPLVFHKHILFACSYLEEEWLSKYKSHSPLKLGFVVHSGKGIDQGQSPQAVRSWV